MTQIAGPTRPHWRLLAAAGLLIGLLAAEGAAAADDRATTPPGADRGASEAKGDECGIVSDEVAAKVLGIKIVRRESNKDPVSGGFGCLKGTARDNNLSRGYFVSVSVFPGNAAVFLDQVTAGSHSVSVPGLGDRAVFTREGILFVVDGADAIMVQVVKAGVAGSREDAVTVAADVLGRRTNAAAPRPVAFPLTEANLGKYTRALNNLAAYVKQHPGEADETARVLCEARPGVRQALTAGGVTCAQFITFTAELQRTAAVASMLKRGEQLTPGMGASAPDIAFYQKHEPEVGRVLKQIAALAQTE